MRMRWLVGVVGAVLVIGLFAGAFRLDNGDYFPEDLTTQQVKDANEQDARCEKNVYTCRQDAEEAAKDPRVQGTLKHLCKGGEKWACGMLLPKRDQRHPML